MSKKFVVPAIVAIALAAVGAVVAIRRNRTDPPPVSATVPRVEDLDRVATGDLDRPVTDESVVGADLPQTPDAQAG